MKNSIHFRAAKEIISSPQFQREIEAAENHQPDAHELHQAATIMYRHIMAGAHVEDGKGVQVHLTDVLSQPCQHEALVKYFRGMAERDAVTDLVKEWCLQQALPAIRRAMVEQVEESWMGAERTQESAA